MPSTASPTEDQSYEVVISMKITSEGKEVDTKKIDLGKMDRKALDNLVGLFSLLSTNLEQIMSFAPQIGKVDERKPAYVG
jgi:hypothetical protein